MYKFTYLYRQGSSSFHRFMLSASDNDKVLHTAAHDIFVFPRYGADKIEQTGARAETEKKKDYCNIKAEYGIDYLCLFGDNTQNEWCFTSMLTTHLHLMVLNYKDNCTSTCVKYSL